MPYYHATRRDRLDSILAHGLGGGVFERNFPGCDPGVYLSNDPVAPVIFLFDRYLEIADPDSVPRDELASWIVIVIDDARLTRPLQRDASFEDDEPVFFVHDGVIDVRGMPIISVNDAMGLNASPSSEQKASTQ